MLNLLADVNFQAHQEFFALGKSKNPLGTSAARNQMAKGLASRIFSVVEKLPITNVVLCVDSRSWRKDFFTGYKASRAEVKKGSMDQMTRELFYGVIDDFCKAAKTKGVIVSKVSGAEGDDLLYGWSKYFNMAGQNCLVMSGDKDTVQLVNSDGDGWTAVWNNNWKNQIIYVPKGWSSRMVESDLFNLSASTDVNAVGNLMKDVFAKVVEMDDASSIVLEKVLLGDDGDDIPSSWDNGKKRLTPSKLAEVLDFMRKKGHKMSSWKDISINEVLLSDLAGVILRVMSDIDGESERHNQIENLRRNETLVWINDKTIPKKLQHEVERHIGAAITEAEQLRDTSKWRKSAILEGSKLDGESAPRANDPFAFIDLPV